MISDCKMIPIEKASKPHPGLAENVVDYFWIVINECVLFYKGSSPQCNENQKIAESLRDRLYPDAEVRKIALISRPIHPQDYL